MAGSGLVAPRLSRLGWLGVAAAPLPVLALLAVTGAVGADMMRLLVLAGAVWAAVFGVVSWRRLDEGGREAIKFAWCWGAGVGMMIAALVLMAVASFPQSLGETVQGVVDGYVTARSAGLETAGATAFFLGGFFAIALMQSLFVMVWAGWWLRRKFGP